MSPPIGSPRAGVVSQVRDAIPNSVIHQHPASTFGTSTWTDDIGTSDMTVNDLTQGTFSNGEDSVDGDGADDNGTFDPTEIGALETWGIGFTFEIPSGASGAFFGQRQSGNEHQIEVEYDTKFTEKILVQVTEGGPTLEAETTETGFDDGSAHALIINKTSNSNIDIYVDDMSVDIANITIDNGFDHTNYNRAYDWRVFSTALDGTNEVYINASVGVLELNNQIYSQSERKGFVSRRPEV